MKSRGLEKEIMKILEEQLEQFIRGWNETKEDAIQKNF